MAKHTTRRDPNWCAGSCQENDDQLAPQKKTKGEESKNATELDTNDRNFWRDRAASNRNSIIAVNCYRVAYDQTGLRIYVRADVNSHGRDPAGGSAPSATRRPSRESCSKHPN